MLVLAHALTRPFCHPNGVHAWCPRPLFFGPPPPYPPLCDPHLPPQSTTRYALSLPAILGCESPSESSSDLGAYKEHCQRLSLCSMLGPVHHAANRAQSNHHGCSSHMHHTGPNTQSCRCPHLGRKGSVVPSSHMLGSGAFRLVPRWDRDACVAARSSSFSRFASARSASRRCLSSAAFCCFSSAARLRSSCFLFLSSSSFLFSSRFCSRCLLRRSASTFFYSFSSTSICRSCTTSSPVSSPPCTSTMSRRRGFWYPGASGFFFQRRWRTFTPGDT